MSGIQESLKSESAPIANQRIGIRKRKVPEPINEMGNDNGLHADEQFY
jgi:hypothetical protein